MSIPVQNLEREEAWKVSNILPPGWHVCKITDSQETESGQGNPQIELDLEAIGGDNAGGSIKDWIVVVPQTYGKVKQLLQAAGVEVPAGDAQLDVAVLKGREVSILVKQEPKFDDPSKTVNKVAGYDMPRFVAPPGNGAGATSKADADIPF